MPPTADDHGHSQLLDSLHHIRGKVRALGVAFGAGVVLTCAVAGLLATVLLDWALNLPGIPRICIAALALGVIGYAVFRGVVRPLLSRLSISDVAGRLEHAFPKFDDRLRSTIDFVRTDMPGSDVMKDRVVREATTMAQQMDLNRALVVTPVVYSLGGGLLAVALVVALSIFFPKYSGIAGSRLLHPFSGPQWPKRVQINADPLPGRVPLGQRIPVTMHLTKGDKLGMEARIYYQYDDGSVEHDIMARAEDGTYTASLDAKGGKLKVWMTAGDDRTEQSVIAVVPRLEIEHVEMVISAPPYAKQPPQSVNLGAGPAMMVAGSGVAMHVTFNKPLDPNAPVMVGPLSPELGPKMPAITWSRDGRNAPVASWTAKDSFRFHIAALDLDGFTNKALEEYEVLVRPDQMPSVMIENPRRDQENTPEATVKLQVHAEDDFGISKIMLIVDRTGGPTTHPANTPMHWEIPLDGWTQTDSSGDRQRFRLNYDWKLPALPSADLKPGDVLHYYVTVNDNYDLADSANPAAPHFTHPAVASGKLRITIISQEELANQAIDVFRSIAGKVKDVERSQNNTKLQTGQLQQDTKDKKEFDKGDRATAERIINQQSTVASQTKQLSTVLEQLKDRLDENKSPKQDLKDLAKEVKDQLAQTAENPMKEATNQLNQANQQKADPKASPQEQKQASDQRSQAMDQSQKNQQKASDELQKALDRLGSIGSLQQSIDAFQKLLDDQKQNSKEMKKFGNEHLGQKPSDMKPEEQKKLADLSKQQDQLAKQTDKATADLQKTAEQTKKSDPSASEAMKQAAQQSKSQNISQQQQSAAQQAQQNQQSSAQNSQKQAELGLQVVLDTLREAERRKLEELAKQLNDAENAVKKLVIRQAGHNVDNLTMQGGDKIKQITDALKQEANRGVGAPPAAPELNQLTSSQEQTERNTRDVSGTMGDLPGGAEIVGHLTRAAGKMIYAITSLRDDKMHQPERLSSAYDPHQTASLAALEDALKSIQEQKKNNQEKLDQQQKEKIRDAYIKVREAQAKLNDTTKTIDGSPRLPDGNLKREDAVRLNQLPGEQQGLANKCKELGKDLSSIGSIEFVSANDELLGTMGQVKDELTKPATGAVAQAHEANVIDELTAIIEALAIKPPEQSKFAKDGGGGGGDGGGGKKMPTEAELRLMKSRQMVINRLTKTAAAMKEKDKGLLLDLSQRQGTLRDNLDKIFKQAGMKDGVGAAPDKKDIKELPEEANAEKIEDDELEKNLLSDKPAEDKAEKDLGLVGDRMFRSKVRLGDDNDPGQTTQKIQERIVKNMDDLIQLARQASAQSKPGKGKGDPKPGEGKEGPPEQANNQGKKNEPGKPQLNPGQTPAQNEQASSGDENNAQLRDDIKNTADRLMKVSPRLHDAVIEGAGEQVIEKYQQLVKDYYRSLATKSKGK